MLQNEFETVDWPTARAQALSALPQDFLPYIQPEASPVELKFPVLQYPQKVNSLNLAKTTHYNGVLKGIKGQYLLFEDQTVFNVRTNEGYRIQWTLQ